MNKEASILIVSKDRKKELEKTLGFFEKHIKRDKQEVRVFLDGCSDDSEELKKVFPWIHWYSSSKTLGASRARHYLYKEAEGEIIFGFDDDSYPLEENFIDKTLTIFGENSEIGIITFKEVRQLEAETVLRGKKAKNELDEWVNQFLGCGFAIRSKVYFETRGFPVWMDIYGEEACLAIETLNLKYKILYTNRVTVLHRKNVEERKVSGGNIFRFRKQLVNSTSFYLIYYPFPGLLKKILFLYIHNFKKYGSKNLNMFKSYVQAFFISLVNLPSILKYRDPVSKDTLDIFNNLKSPQF